MSGGRDLRPAPRPDQPLSLRATAGARRRRAFRPAGGGAEVGLPGPWPSRGAGGDASTIPILAGQEVVGAALPRPTGGPAQRPPGGSAVKVRPPSTAGERPATAPLDPATGATPSLSPDSPAPRSSATGSSPAAERPPTPASDASGRVSSLSRLASQLAVPLTVDAVGGPLVDHAVTELGAEFGLVYAADRRRRSFVLVHARGYPVGLAEREARLSADSTARSPGPRGPATRSRSVRPTRGGASSLRSPTCRR